MRRLAALAVLAPLVALSARADDWKDEDVAGVFVLEGTHDGRRVVGSLSVVRAGGDLDVTRRTWDPQTGAGLTWRGRGRREGKRLSVELEGPAGIVGVLTGGKKPRLEGRYVFDDGGRTLAGVLAAEHAGFEKARDSGARPASSKIEAGPYVQDARARSAVIAWRTKKKTEGAVEYGPTPALGRTAEASKDERHEVRLADLEPGGRCFYRVLVEGEPATPVESFETAARPGRTFRVAVWGDSGTGSKEQRAVARALEREEVAFAIHLGDLLYPRGTRSDKEWDAKFFEPYGGALRGRCLFPTFGNHEAEEPRGYEDVFAVPANNPAKTERYFSYEWGDAKFVHVDTSGLEFRDSQQAKWLRGELASNVRKWLVLVTHIPLRSSKEEGDIATVRQGLLPILEDHPVSLILAGHKHRYERSRVAGATHVLSGGGGADLSDVDANDDDVKVAVKKHHHVVLSIGPDAIRGRAVDPDGKPLDTFEVK